MGVALSCPFGRSGVLDKIHKIRLDHCLLDAKGIMQTFSIVFLYRKMGVALSCPFGRSGMLDRIPKISLDHCLLKVFKMGVTLTRPSRHRPNIDQWPMFDRRRWGHMRTLLIIRTYCKNTFKKYQTYFP